MNKPLKSVVTMRSDDDQIRMLLLGVLSDDISRVANLNTRGDASDVVLAQVGGQAGTRVIAQSLSRLQSTPFSAGENDDVGNST